MPDTDEDVKSPGTSNNHTEQSDRRVRTHCLELAIGSMPNNTDAYKLTGIAKQFWDFIETGKE